MTALLISIILRTNSNIDETSLIRIDGNKICLYNCKVVAVDPKLELCEYSCINDTELVCSARCKIDLMAELSASTPRIEDRIARIYTFAVKNIGVGNGRTAAIFFCMI